MSRTHVCCLLCQSPEIEPLKGYEAKHLVRCQACGFVFCGLIPTQEELLTYYQRYTREDGISALTIARYHERLDEFEAYRRHNRLLDVGCGNGDFLQVARQRGWEVYGTEFTDEALAVCTAKGLNMQQGPLNPAYYAPGYFDVITSFEVIEHINTPAGEAGHMAALLRPGGLAYVTTPNFNCLARRLLGRHWGVIMYPEHLGYFTATTLRQLFEARGFRTGRVLATGISPARIRYDAGAWFPQPAGPPPTAAELYAPPFRREDEQLRQQAQARPAVRRAIATANWLLTQTRLGDALKAYFIREE